MTMRKRGLLYIMFALLLLPTAIVSAGDFCVDYVEGWVDVKVGSAWEELYIGDVLSESDVLRVESDSLVELSGGDDHLTLIKPGVYSISSLVEQSRSRNTGGIGSLLAGKMEAMFSQQEVPTQSTVGGVRAAEAATDDGFGWIESDTKELLESGRRLLEEKQYEEALTVFSEAYDFALDEEEISEAGFYLGYTYALLQKPGRAMEYLSEVEINKDVEYYYTYYFVRGNLLINGFAYEQAIEFLSSFDEAYANASETQTITFLLGLAYHHLDNTADAKIFMQKARDLDPESDVGRTADRIYSQL